MDSISPLIEDDLAGLPVSQISDTDQFMIVLNFCAVVCGGVMYFLLSQRQKQTAGQRDGYFSGPFMSLAEASQSWKVYRQCGSKAERDLHVCNLCGFAIKASPTESPGPCSCSELAAEDTKSEAAKGLKQRKQAGKKGKKS
eukprot:TRINITY_DN75468_c0_g1_i1.p1 TRINITY_DN75468_c0_g1~~TRINITY_DN75468_c0_g1_i1.p1  ORF type:complete len:141 (-),score=20.93 TRINITY_DN75468_c0_g1_i1:86-508(-)